MLKKYCNHHLILAALYGAAIVVAVLMKFDLVRALEVAFLDQNFLTAQWQTGVQHIYHVQVFWLVIALLAILTIFHLVSGLNFKIYRQALKRGFYPARWLSLGFSLGLLLMINALLFEIVELGYVILLGVSMIVFSGVGLLAEYCTSPALGLKASTLNQYRLMYQKLPTFLFMLHKITGTLPWLLVGMSVWVNIEYSAQSLEFAHYLAYFSGLFLVWGLFIITNLLVTKRPFQAESNYARIDITYSLITAICVAGWLGAIITLTP